MFRVIPEHLKINRLPLFRAAVRPETPGRTARRGTIRTMLTDRQRDDLVSVALHESSHGWIAFAHGVPRSAIILYGYCNDGKRGVNSVLTACRSQAACASEFSI